MDRKQPVQQITQDRYNPHWHCLYQLWVLGSAKPSKINIEILSLVINVLSKRECEIDRYVTLLCNSIKLTSVNYPNYLTQ